eukprot:6621185-Pyramimonas_sp.AAC.1
MSVPTPTALDDARIYWKADALLRAISLYCTVQFSTSIYLRQPNLSVGSVCSDGKDRCRTSDRFILTVRIGVGRWT